MNTTTSSQSLLSTGSLSYSTNSKLSSLKYHISSSSSSTVSSLSNSLDSAPQLSFKENVKTTTHNVCYSTPVLPPIHYDFLENIQIQTLPLRMIETIGNAESFLKDKKDLKTLLLNLINETAKFNVFSTASQDRVNKILKIVFKLNQDIPTRSQLEPLAIMCNEVLIDINKEEKTSKKGPYYFHNKVAFYSGLNDLQNEYGIQLLNPTLNPQFSDIIPNISSQIETETHIFIFKDNIPPSLNSNDHLDHNIQFNTRILTIIPKLDEEQDTQELDTKKTIKIARHTSLNESFNSYKESTITEILPKNVILTPLVKIDTQNYALSIFEPEKHCSLNVIIKKTNAEYKKETYTLPFITTLLTQTATLLASVNEKNLSFGRFCLDNIRFTESKDGYTFKLINLEHAQFIGSETPFYDIRNDHFEVGYPTVEEVIKIKQNPEQTIDLNNLDTFSWGVEMLRIFSTIGSLPEFPTYPLDIPGTRLTPDNFSTWTTKAQTYLDTRLDTYLNTELKQILAQTLLPQENRPTMIDIEQQLSQCFS